MKYSPVNEFSLSYDFLNNIFFLLAYFIRRIQYIIHIAFRKCVNHLFRLSVNFPVNSRLLSQRFGRVKSYMWIFDYARVSTPDP